MSYLDNTGVATLAAKLAVKVQAAIQAATVDFTGATSSAAGAHGFVPAPSAGDQGKLLRGDGAWTNGYVASFNGSTGAITYTETDPTVPSWAKASSKPSYTASEVGAVPTSRKVNGKALSADITLSASDVGALSSSTTIPSKTSDLTNDSGFITGYTETDPTVPSWAKAASKPSYTAVEVGAQPTLVSGTNIKTVNNESLLGSGNITIQGGSATAMTETEIQAAFDEGWPATYSVQITLSSYGGNGVYFGSCTVYGADSANVNSTTTTLGTIDGADASQLFAVGVDTPYLVVVLSKSASASGSLYVDTSGISTTGLVTSMNSGVQNTNPARMLFAVNGDGTVTISNVNYSYMAGGGEN